MPYNPPSSAIIWRRGEFVFRIRETLYPLKMLLSPGYGNDSRDATRRYFLVEFYDQEELIDTSWFSPEPGSTRMQFTEAAISWFTLDEDSGAFDDEDRRMPERLRAWQRQCPSRFMDLQMIHTQILEASETAS